MKRSTSKKWSEETRDKHYIVIEKAKKKVKYGRPAERVTDCRDLCSVLRGNKAEGSKALLWIQGMTSNGGNTNTALVNSGEKKITRQQSSRGENEIFARNVAVETEAEVEVENNRPKGRQVKQTNKQREEGGFIRPTCRGWRKKQVETLHCRTGLEKSSQK